MVVTSIEPGPCGKVLDVEGARFIPGRWARECWPLVLSLAKAAGCNLVRCTSARPLDRLPLGLAKVATVYAMEVPR